MPRPKSTRVTTAQHLANCLSALRDDPTKHWSEYPCLEWDRGRNGKSGPYGKVRWKGKREVVSRVAFKLTNGDIDSETLVCHHCDNPPCFRPIHLFAGKSRDNIHDSMRKGRFARTRKRGELNHSSKLTADKVIEIRRMLQAGSPKRRLAALFDVCQRTIASIEKRATWSHV